MHTHTAALSLAEDKRETEFFYLLGLTIHSTPCEYFYAKMNQAKDEVYQIIKIPLRVFMFAQGLALGVDDSCRLSKTFGNE